MKKAILFIVLGLFMINAGCGSRGGSDSSSSGSTAVSIRLGQAGPSSGSIAGAVSSSAIPAGITTIRVTVSADDMVTIIKEVLVAGQSSVTITLDIPNGPNRHILVEALSASGDVLYSGEAVVNLGGEPLQLTITMSSLSTCDLYVDTAGADDSDCTDINDPCRTITYALNQTAGNVNICVATGTYDSETGESFPITLKSGTNLVCKGENHSTIIDGRFTESDTIYGASDARITGCYIYPDWDAVGIDDTGEVITVDDCVINGVEGSWKGIYLSADSTVKNSTITNVMGVEGGGNGIYVFDSSPVITGNTLDNNYNGIYIESGSPSISSNTIGSINNGNNYGIYVVTGAASVSGNTITYNSEGLRISGGSPVINSNTLSCNSGVDLDNLRVDGTIDAQNNSWDNVPPSAILYPSSCNGAGEDICAPNGGSVDFDGALLAPDPCNESGPT